MNESLKMFKALCDETRLKIVKFLLPGERCVCEIVPYVKRTQSTVSIQLAKLENLSVVESRREGKSVYYRIINEEVRRIIGMLERMETKKKDEAMREIKYWPIGVIHSPFKKPRGTPIQSKAAEGVRGTVEIYPEYAEGLRDIDGFSHIILIYHFHLSKKFSLRVKPYMDDQTHGVFSTRSPSRPNPIGVSIVRVNNVTGNMLSVQDVDVIDGTPLLDIKPYVPEFDMRNTREIGWLKERIHKLHVSRDDGGFTKPPGR